jgi:hypothetical protein
MKDSSNTEQVNPCAQIIIVGHNFPLGTNPGTEGVRAEFGNGFLDITYYIDRPVPRDVAFFNNGAIHYGVYEEDQVPFFLLQLRLLNLESWTMEVTLNIHKLHPDSRQEWFDDREANATMIYLVDANTNTLLGMRSIGLSTEVSDQVRQICQQQLTRYDDMHQVDEVIERIMCAKDTRALLEATVLRPLQVS